MAILLPLRGCRVYLIGVPMLEMESCTTAEVGRIQKVCIVITGGTLPSTRRFLSTDYGLNNFIVGCLAKL
jgi:hypothetical protein